ncbi:MAG: prolipoprotein diacylglyceryl transferase [Syntrophobacterales bacterium]|nr:MAG: prolipoprotein diacylglyceryl transferase [Syntrophobacterales bacterium]
MPWAVTFTDPKSLAPLGIPLHPTQLYSALNALAIFFVLMAVRRIKHFDGEIFWLYLCIYSFTRFFIEMVRGDDRGMFFSGLFSTSQVVGMGLFLLSLFMVSYLWRRSALSRGKNRSTRG